jgi:hypothetical protein
MVTARLVFVGEGVSVETGVLLGWPVEVGVLLGWPVKVAVGMGVLVPVDVRVGVEVGGVPVKVGVGEPTSRSAREV